MSEDYENIDEKTGDHAEYQKKRAAVAKRFGVKSCSELEGDKKKACYKALDDAHVADHEEEYNLGEANWEESPINDDRYKLSNAAPHMNVRANDDMEGPYMYKDGIFYWSPSDQKFWSEDAGGWIPDTEAKDMMYSFMKGLWQGRKGSLPAVDR